MKRLILVIAIIAGLGALNTLWTTNLVHAQSRLAAVDNGADPSLPPGCPGGPAGPPAPNTVCPNANANTTNNAAVCANTATPGLNLDCSNGKNPIYALLQFTANWAIRLLGVLAVLAIVISGIQYIVSQGNPEGVKNAKNRLTNAIIGLVLLALMFVILRFLGVLN